MTETTTGRSILLAVLRNLALTLYALFALFPLLWMLILSFKPDNQMLTTMFRFNPTWQNYAEIFLRSDYLQYFLNNLIVSTGAVVLALIVGVPAAYALARFKFPGREDLAFTMLSFRFAPELFVILPLFLIYQRIGLLDTYFGLIWVYQLIALPLLIWVVRGYFEDISPELEYAAQLDGYSWWQVFLKVLLPLVRPGLAARRTFGVYLFVEQLYLSAPVVRQPRADLDRRHFTVYRFGQRTVRSAGRRRDDHGAPGGASGAGHSAAPGSGSFVRRGEGLRWFLYG